MTTLACVSDSENQRILRIKNGPLDTNCYIYQLSQTGACLLIDPGFEQLSISKTMEEMNLEPKAVLMTHGHFDHIASAAFFQAEYGVSVYMHPADKKVAEKSNFVLMALKIEGRIKLPKVDVQVTDDYQLDFGVDQGRYFHLPGHTPGSCAIQLGDAVFIGDTFNRDDMVLNSLPGENKAQLKTSIQRLGQIISDHAWIYPGHGGAGTWGDIKRKNAMLRNFIGLDDGPGLRKEI